MNENKKLVDKTIKEYLKKKIKEAFTDDYALIEPQMENLTEKYSLKELIIIVRVEIDKIKNRRGLH